MPRKDLIRLLDPVNFTPRKRILVAVGIYLLAVAVQLIVLLARTQGHQIYLLDDSYIHAAIARNLVQHHVYGVTPYATVFASSSVLWPYLVAAVFYVIGVHAWVPFALNVIAGILTLWAAERLFQTLAPWPDSATGRQMCFLALMLLIFGAPLLGMTFVGMEHVLHLASVLLLLEMYARAAQDKPVQDKATTPSNILLLCAYAALATSLRYESLFLLFFVCLGLLWHKRIGTSALTAIAGFVPVVSFGLYALSRGSSFFPGPLSVKTAGNTSFLATALRNFSAISALAGAVTFSFIFGILLLAFALYWIRKTKQASNPRAEVLAIILGAFLLQAGLASFGWFFRYEVYLLGSLTTAFLAVCCALLPQPGPARPVALSAVTLLVLIFIGRGVGIAWLSPRNAVAIYEQQYQTGRFIARYYPGHSVALNDIGAPTFMTDFRCLDLAGLASPDVAKLAINDRDGLTALALDKKVEIGIRYPHFFGRPVPSGWVFVARFTIANIPGHLFIGEKDVDFYGTTPAFAALLAQQIETFTRELPPGVHVDMDPHFAHPGTRPQ